MNNMLPILLKEIPLSSLDRQIELVESFLSKSLLKVNYIKTTPKLLAQFIESLAIHEDSDAKKAEKSALKSRVDALTRKVNFLLQEIEKLDADAKLGNIKKYETVIDVHSSHNFTEKLPADILKLIFEYLTLDTLAKASKVCKRWQEQCNNLQFNRKVFYLSKTGLIFDISRLAPKPTLGQFKEAYVESVGYYKNGFWQVKEEKTLEQKVADLEKNMAACLTKVITSSTSKNTK